LRAGVAAPLVRARAPRSPGGRPVAELVATGMPSDRVRSREVRQAYVRWFEELPVRLWLTVNAREPLWPGSWRFVLDQALDVVESASGLQGQTAWIGVCETNRDRLGFHLHALGLGGEQLLEPRRTGPGGLVSRIEQLVAPLHAAYRVYERDQNAASVTLKSVQRYGNGLRSLNAYFTKTLHAYMRKDGDADWFEAGDVGRFLTTSRVVLS
jgi:hypothetical protein